MEIVVHDLAQAKAVLQVAQEAGVEVELRSAPGAAAYAGVGYLQALGEELGLSLRIDCGVDPALVMAALRTGCRSLAFGGAAELCRPLAEMASRDGAEFRFESSPPSCLELRPGEDPRPRLLTWLQAPGCSSGARASAHAAAGAAPPTRETTMSLTPQVKEILSWYEGENPGVKGNLVRLLNQGRLAGTGKLVILPVDQGYEHGPARCFAPNPAAYDPHYLYQLAIDAGMSGYAAPLGALEAGAETFAGQLPTILKMNSANSLAGSNVQDQALTGSVQDALRIGCVGVGFTIYPGSDSCYDMMEEIKEIIREAKSVGLVPVVWSYPRGGKVKDETALDIVAYAAHIAALLGAVIIKVKPPTANLDLAAAKTVYEENDIDRSTLAARVRHIMQCCFAGRRVVVFSGGEAAGNEELLETVRQIKAGGGGGSIMGRNSFRRTKPEALALLDEIMKIYLNEA
jgi:class I fructose-bisphosphate aldolase